jgi:hypothetical protein
MSPEPIKPASGRRTVCDHCRRRRKSILPPLAGLFRDGGVVVAWNWHMSAPSPTTDNCPLTSVFTNIGIRCDGEFPCNQCNHASLSCKREHVPKRRGPKRGSGRVINELRAQDGDGPAGRKAPPPSNGSTSGSHTSGPPS